MPWVFVNMTAFSATIGGQPMFQRDCFEAGSAVFEGLTEDPLRFHP
jgi:hypothetical protein